MTHWHYWCWADGGSGFQFSFSTDTRAPEKPPGVSIWMQREGPWLVQNTLGPGSTVDLLGDGASHFSSATLSSVTCEMRPSFPTLPASQVKWEKRIARALKRIMGRQGVIMALASNPLNSLKTREGGGSKRQKGERLLETHVR